MKPKPNQPDPSAKCAACSHRFDEHRGKRGCEHMDDSYYCPCPRFETEPDHA